METTFSLSIHPTVDAGLLLRWAVGIVSLSKLQERRRTGQPGVLLPMGPQRASHSSVTGQQRREPRLLCARVGTSLQHLLSVLLGATGVAESYEGSFFPIFLWKYSW